MWVKRQIESLEQRVLLAVHPFFVTNTLDSGTGSFRQAILDANAVGPTDSSTIQFEFLGTGVQTIQPRTSLPFITGNVQIGGTQNSTISDTRTPPLIELDGELAGENAVGLFFDRNTPGNTESSLVSGLIIDNWGKQGIDIQGDAPTNVALCWIGTDSSGKHSAGNDSDGILVETSDCTIFFDTISANSLDGIHIAPGSDNTVIGICNIGTNTSGTKALANQSWGIQSEALGTKVIKCVVSGNVLGGMTFTAANAVVENCEIGTNIAGTAAISNIGPGINLFDAPNAQIGSSESFFQNISGGSLISGNHGAGISAINSPGLVIFANRIGTNADGTAAIGNTILGVNLISNNSLITKNLISGNGFGGIVIDGTAG